MNKFKVGDNIKNVHTGKLATIKLIHYVAGFTVYVFEDGDKWNTSYECHWELA
jgi:hypothetical protein